jgi:hypothetical protein
MWDETQWGLVGYFLHTQGLGFVTAEGKKRHVEKSALYPVASIPKLSASKDTPRLPGPQIPVLDNKTDNNNFS